MNRRISSSLEEVDGQVTCRGCGHSLGPAEEPWKPMAILDEAPMRGIAGAPYSGGENVVLRRFACPKCGVLLDSETALPEDPFLNDKLLG